jgi:hypothetical protein
MVDLMVTAAAAIAAASTMQQKTLSVPFPQPTSLKAGDHVRVQTERRRAVRAAVNAPSSLDDMMPMIKRAEADNALTTTKALLEKTDRHLRSGNTEQAMLSLDEATTSLERARNMLPTDSRVMDLDFRERDLRKSMGQPAMPSRLPRKSLNNTAKDGSPDKDEAPVVPPKRDELPVG